MDQEELVALQDRLVWLSDRRGNISRSDWNRVSYGYAPDYDTTAQSIVTNLNRVFWTADHPVTLDDYNATVTDTNTIEGWVSSIENILGVTPVAPKWFAPLKSSRQAFLGSLTGDMEGLVKKALIIVAVLVVAHALISRVGRS